MASDAQKVGQFSEQFLAFTHSKALQNLCSLLYTQVNFPVRRV